jgi:protein-L-isoaspartate(D-aspartate) O-methyltransferase
MSMDFETAHSNINMVEQPIRTWDVLDPAVLGACSQVARDLFMPAAYRNLAYTDTEIELGHGQCMMTPQIEARLLQSLGIRSSDRVLAVGTGSSDVTALLATLAADVTSIEIFAEVSEQAPLIGATRAHEFKF